MFSLNVSEESHSSSLLRRRSSSGNSDDEMMRPCQSFNHFRHWNEGVASDAEVVCCKLKVANVMTNIRDEVGSKHSVLVKE